MTAKEYLQQVRLKDAEINNLIADKKGLKRMLLSIGGIQEGERVQTTPNKDKYGTLYAKIDAKEREITRKIDELIDFKSKVSGEINALAKDAYITILHKRYIRLSSWEQIAVDLNFTVRHILNLHGQALIEFERKYPDISSVNETFH